MILLKLHLLYSEFCFTYSKSFRLLCFSAPFSFEKFYFVLYQYVLHPHTHTHTKQQQLLNKAKDIRPFPPVWTL